MQAGTVAARRSAQPAHTLTLTCLDASQSRWRKSSCTRTSCTSARWTRTASASTRVRRRRCIASDRDGSTHACCSSLAGRAVSRLRCRGDNWETDMSLDVNVDIYPLKARVQRSACARDGATDMRRHYAPAQATDKFAFALSATLSEDGTPDDGTFDQVRAQCRAAAPARCFLTPPLCVRRAKTKSRSWTSSSTSCTVRAGRAHCAHPRCAERGWQAKSSRLGRTAAARP